MNEISLLRLPAVIKLTGYSRSTIYALQSQGKFPASVKLAGGGAVAWRSSEIRAWIARQGKVAG
jgi:prophage regulatory protein